jgi:membrane protease YdiL (CAAX protease family)
MRCDDVDAHTSIAVLQGGTSRSMTDTSVDTDPMPYLRVIAPATPYVAMVVGLFVFSSGWAGILLYHLGIVTIVTLSKSWTFPRMRRDNRCRQVLGVMVLGAAFVGPALYAAWTTIQLTDLDLATALADLRLSGLSWTVFILYYMTVNPVLEETFWRGYLGSEARRPTWNDIWFAGYHVLVIASFVGVGWVAAGFVGLLAAAWLWRQAARDCDGLLIPVVSHATADASLILAAALLVG